VCGGQGVQPGLAARYVVGILPGGHGEEVVGRHCPPRRDSPCGHVWGTQTTAVVAGGQVFVPETVVVVCVTQATPAIVGGQVFDPVTTVVLALPDDSVPDFDPDDFDPPELPELPDTSTGGLVRAAIPEYNAKAIVRRRMRETADFPNFSFIRWFPVKFRLFGLVVFETWGALNGRISSSHRPFFK
jgi:hypothetical protein